MPPLPSSSEQEALSICRMFLALLDPLSTRNVPVVVRQSVEQIDV